MDNNISEIRKKIRMLRISTLELGDVMRDQVRRDGGCSDVAGQILSMRAEIARLIGEWAILGDREPISTGFIARVPAPFAVVRSAKQRLKRVG